MKKGHILLVEDNEGDILLTKEAFEHSSLVDKLSIVRNGKDAMDFLTKKGKYAHEVLPDFVLLDVNIPKKNGHEVLQFIKNTENIKHIPVVMFTTSSTPKDITMAYENHANCYITKPVDVKSFQIIVNQIESFWLSLVQLPPNYHA
ncbi:response regulator [Flectobacillus longus]|uniref:response regulator n=1 Tax=Flectobacillus longus TaxID=2984207 RepID=UPI0024B847C0|nr:response regulator [Flectobacillus longus]MDI9879268.1 response regulator [Flectobacillus longus]